MWLWHKQGNDTKNDKKDEAKGNGNATLADHVRLCNEAEKALGKGGKK